MERKLTIVYNRGIAPIKFTTDAGDPSGILNEYWQLLGKKSGLDLQFKEVDTFVHSLEMVKNGEADLHAGLFFTEERSRLLAYSHPVLDLQYYLYSGPDIPVFASLEETQGYVLGVVQGGYTENYIKKVIPKSHLLIYDDFTSLFDAVLAGEIKVFVASDIHLNHYLVTRNRPNPFNHHEGALYKQTYYGATAKTNSSLSDTIIAAQALLTKQDIQELKDHWIKAERDIPAAQQLATLTPEEISWIKKHPVVRVSNEMNWPPFDFNEDGSPMGLSIDLLNLIAKRVGLQLDYRSGYSWDQLQTMLKDKELDIIHSLNSSAERSQFILFTDSYISNQSVIVTASDRDDIRTLEDLNNKTIATIAGYNQQQVLKTTLDDARFLHVDSPLEALKAVASGQADATIRYNGVATYLINHHLLTNLKFVNEFKVAGDNLHELFLGVRNDWPLLQSILQKGLDSVTTKEMEALKQQWTSMEPKRPWATVALSQEEQQWLQDHPQITLGADYKWPPFDFVGLDGKHAGMAADYIRLIAQRTGLTIHVRTGVWSEILTQMQNGELDGLTCAVPTKDRLDYLDFTTPYLSVPAVIVVKNTSTSIRQLKDLFGKTVSINRNSYMHEWLTSHYPQITLHLSTSNEASLEAVSYGEADAYIGNLAVADHIIRERLLTNLDVVKRLNDIQTKTSLAVAKNQPILLGILQKALESISEFERQEILDRWYIAATAKKVILTDQEKMWLQNHPVIRISGAPDWAPISYRNQAGNPMGIVADYLNLLAAKSNLQFQTVAATSWTNVLAMAEAGQIDIVNGIASCDDTSTALDHTDNFIQADGVFITRKDVHFLKSLEDIDNQRIGTRKNFAIAEALQRDHPHLSLQLYENALSGLQAVAHGDIDIFVVDLPTFEYYSRQRSLANLKISGVAPYSFRIAMGVAKGNPELVSILNKTLQLISQKEKNKIYSNWVSLKKPLIDYSLMWKIILSASVFLLALFYWNRRLADEVALRKEAEQQALQASRAKSDFLANMSHEIRTPMNSVLGFAELLDNMIHDPEQKSYLKSIRSGGRALLDIINDILDLSKIEAGKMVVAPEAFSLHGLFVEMEDFFQARMAQKNLDFNIELPEDFPPYIEMDPVRLRQILINLIGNALKFTDKGHIRLLCHKVQREATAATLDFTLSVADTGIGIPLDQQQLIFHKFEQREGFDASRYGGTGLGLAICQSLTQLMGGTLSVQSTPMAGAQFSATFHHIPIVQKQPVEQKHVSIPVSRFLPANVLIADDVRDNRTLITGHFKGSALRFHEVANGKDALALLSEIDIALVLLDLRMPVLSGYETITAMQQDTRFQHIPVIAITASVMGEDLEKVRQYGFDGYLRKPVSRQDLFRAMAQFLPLTDGDERSVEQEFTPVDIPSTQLHPFLTAIDNELMPQWQAVKDKGDFDLIAEFSDHLHQLASSHAIQPIIDFAAQLREHVLSFDIIEVDILMKQFPDIISAMKQHLPQQGEG